MKKIGFLGFCDDKPAFNIEKIKKVKRTLC